MTLSTQNPHAKRRWILLAGAVAVGTLVLAAVAFAVHDLKFQLDGDTSSVDIAPIIGITRPVDWNDLYNTDKSVVTSPPTGFAPGDMSTDYRIVASGGKAGQFDTSDGTTYTGGSKDTLDIHSGWRCVGANNVTNKGDITNAYATKYSAANGDSILYFAMEKYVPQGTNNIGIWFLQDKNVGCLENGTGNGNAFDGIHKNGDILVVSAFDSGGKVSTILAYSWDTSLNNGAGGLHLETPTAGVDCRQTPVTNPSDSLCGAANEDAITIQWAHASNSDGSGNAAGASTTIPAATFFEGGINQSAFDAFKGKCFTHFLFDTRSATSTTATLYDYALGTIGKCESTTVTTPKQYNAGNDTVSDIPAAGLTIPTTASGGSIQVKDSALITVNGIASFNSSVTFSLCGPLDLTSTSNCATGGTQVGTAKAVTSSPSTVLSDAVTLTSAGRYCWRAVFAADDTAGVPGSSDPKPTGDNTTTECFKVNPVTPTLSTTAVDSTGAALTGPVDFGQAIYDKSALSGTASQPATPPFFLSSTNPPPTQAKAGGTIVFKLYGPSATQTPTTADCTKLAKDANGVDFPSAGISVTVDGDSTAYPAANPSTVTFTPGAPGYYFWKAAYGGNSPNTTAAPLDNSGNPTQHNADCSVASERVQVRQIPTTISTAQSAIPNDSATITSSVTGNNLGAGGTVLFRLYGPTGGATPKTAAENCAAGSTTLGTGGLLYKQAPITLVGGAHSETVNTTNTTVSVNVSETYVWNVTYAPAAADTAHTGRQSACQENTVLTFNNDAGPGTLFP